MEQNLTMWAMPLVGGSPEGQVNSQVYVISSKLLPFLEPQATLFACISGHQVEIILLWADRFSECLRVLNSFLSSRLGGGEVLFED